MGGYEDKGTDISKIFFPIKSLNCDLLACSAILHPSTLVFLFSTFVSQCLPSTVLRRFIRASTKKLKELMERRLDTRYLVATIIDVKRFKDEEMIIALGITAEGKKVLLGFTQAGTENASVCKEFLASLLRRGLTIEEGVLCVIDDSKGIRKAVEEAFGGYALIQRCQWHKKENVID